MTVDKGKGRLRIPVGDHADPTCKATRDVPKPDTSTRLRSWAGATCGATKIELGSEGERLGDERDRAESYRAPDVAETTLPVTS